jgi:DNA-nicking Smr family endonuclease
MKRPLKPEELRLWSTIAATIHPLPGRSSPSPPAAGPSSPALAALPPKAPLRPSPAKAPRPSTKVTVPRAIEPNRHHRIARERDEIGARIDLHGLDQDRAREALEGFLRRAWDEGYRAVLVITGKGALGDGVLKRRAPEWLAGPALHPIVAGISEAHRRHGGEGALYVALKRKPRG